MAVPKAVARAANAKRTSGRHGLPVTGTSSVGRGDPDGLGIACGTASAAELAVSPLSRTSEVRVPGMTGSMWQMAGPLFAAVAAGANPMLLKRGIEKATAAR